MGREKIRMRRVIAIFVVAVVGTLAFTQIGPVPETPPDFESLPSEVGGATGDPSAWYCPWVAAGALRDSTFALASLIDLNASITLPNPNPVEDPDVGEIRLLGPGARSVDTGEIARRGMSPGTVEFDDGPAVATTEMWSDEILTGDRCVVSVPKEWQLVGGITAEGFTLQLQLFNPFAEPAKVSIESITEFGRAPLSGFESFDVPGRSWATEDLSRLIPFLDIVTLTIRSESGIVIPSFVLDDGTDEASWPGIGQSTTWDFPVTSVPGLDPTLVISNTGSVGATVSIDLFTEDGPLLDADGRIVSPLEPLRIHLADLAEPPFAVRVRSNAPIGAIVQAAPPGTLPKTESAPSGDRGGAGDDSAVGTTVAGDAPTDTTTDATADGDVVEPTIYDGIAAMPGNAEPLKRWLVPGLGIVPGATTSIWVLNPSGDDATVSVKPLGVSARKVTEVVIAAGTYVEIPVAPISETGNSGMLVEADVPISVAVSLAGPQGVAFIGGVGIG